MKRFWMIVFALAASALGPLHARASTVNCNTAGQTITAAINALAPAAGYQTINVSGKCVENVYVPPNLSVNLVAATGTTLTPATATNLTISVNGKLMVSNLTIATGSNTGIYVYQGGFVNVQGGTIAGAGEGLEAAELGHALIQNVVFSTTGTNSAINTWSFGTVEIDGISNFQGRNGTTITDAKGGGINCSSGFVLLNTFGDGTVVLTGNATTGISLNNGCNLNITGGSALKPVTIEKTGISGNYSVALQINGGTAILSDLHIVDNTYIGIDAVEGASVQIAGHGTEITGNTGQAIVADQNAVVHIVPWNGVNAISNPSGNTNPLFNCYQGGKIYVDQIANTITPAPTSADIGCLTVGGP